MVSVFSRDSEYVKRLFWIYTEGDFTGSLPPGDDLISVGVHDSLVKTLKESLIFHELQSHSEGYLKLNRGYSQFNRLFSHCPQISTPESTQFGVIVTLSCVSLVFRYVLQCPIKVLGKTLREVYYKPHLRAHPMPVIRF